MIKFYLKMPYLPLIPVWVTSNGEGCKAEIRRATGIYAIGAVINLPLEGHELVMQLESGA